MTLELTLAPSGAAVATPRHPLAPHFSPAPFQILPRGLQGHSPSTGICRRADADMRHLPQTLKGTSPGYQRDRTVGPGEPQRHRI